MRRLRRVALEHFGARHLTERLMPQVSNLKHPLKFGLLMLCLALLIVAWANPQRGYRREKAKQLSSDIIVAFDVSNSMLARDLAPSRLERARAFTLDLVHNLRTDRIGLICFAGNAYQQMPLTSDYAAALLQLQTITPNQLPTQGTSFNEMIEVVERSFPEKSRAQRILIIISDGEDHGSDFLSSISKSVENGLKIFTIGVGTPQGELIPIELGNGVVEMKRDPQTGEPVRTRLQEENLKSLAKAGGGDYFNLSNQTGIIEALQKHIEKMAKEESEVRSFSDFESYFQWFVAAALLLLTFEFMLPYRRSVWLEDKDFFK
jgi:Ca-activated chloride channel family protein